MSQRERFCVNVSHCSIDHDARQANAPVGENELVRCKSAPVKGAGHEGGVVHSCPSTSSIDEVYTGPSTRSLVNRADKLVNRVSDPSITQAECSVGAMTKRLQNRAVGAPHRSRQGSRVTLHVYDLHRMTKGLPLFHVGVELYSVEFFFSADGILSHPPGGHQVHVHREVVELGTTRCTMFDVQKILDRMCKEWEGSTYNVFARNCQTWAAAFCRELGLGECIPPEYCRLSDFGRGWRSTAFARALSTVLHPSVASCGSASVSSGTCGTPICESASLNSGACSWGANPCKSTPCCAATPTSGSTELITCESA